MHRLEDLGTRFVTRKRVRAYAVIALVVAVAQYSYGLIRARGLIDGFGHVIGGDLLAFALSGTMLRAGEGARLYDFPLQLAYEQRVIGAAETPGLIPYMNPPFAALAYWPWSFPAPLVAFALWSILSLALLGTAVWLASASQGFDKADRRFAVLVSLSFFPVIENLMAGNSAIFSLFLYTLIFLALKRRRDGVAGALLGIELLKPQLVLALIIVLIWKRRWRAVLSFAAVGIGWCALSIALVDRGSLISYLTMLPGLSRLAFVGGFPYSLLSSIYALFLLPLGANHFAVATILGSLAALGLVALLLNAWTGDWQPESAKFDVLYALALVVTCLISQYILLHDLSILVLSAILLAGYFTKSSPERGWGTVRVGLAVVWAVCWLGPVLTVYIRVPLVPLALVLLAWTAWNGLPKGIPGYIRVRLLAPRGPAGADPGPDRLGIFH